MCIRDSLNSGRHPKEFFQQVYHTIANGKEADVYKRQGKVSTGTGKAAALPTSRKGGEK